MAFDPDPNLLKSLERDVAPRLERGALELSAHLDENTKAGTRSGRKYSGLPRQSSSPKEYPQEQSGDLRASVGVEGEGLSLRVGFFGDTQKKLNALEFGYAPGNLKARKPIGRTLESTEARKAALDAMKDGS